MRGEGCEQRLLVNGHPSPWREQTALLCTTPDGSSRTYLRVESLE